MGQKVNPIGFRLGVRRNWSARWYANKHDYSKFMEEDNLIRGFLEKKLRYASVPRIVIERASTRTRVTIWTARPGIVIGRKGQELDSLKDSLNKTVGKDIRLVKISYCTSLLLFCLFSRTGILLGVDSRSSNK